VLPQKWLWNFVPAFGLILKLDASTGEVVDSLQDATGRIAWASSAVEHNGYLFIGSVREEIEWISRYPLPGAVHHPAAFVASAREQAEDVPAPSS